MNYEELQKLLTNKQAAAERLEKMSTDDLFYIVSSRLRTPNVSKFIDDILEAFGQSENSLKKKRKFIIALLDTFRNETEISSNQMNNIVSSIVFNFPSFTSSHLKHFVDHCVESINENKDKSTCWKDLLPTLLELLQDEKMIICDSSSVTGSYYKSSIIKSICNGNWDHQILTSLAKMFGEIRMDKQELETAKRVLCSKIPLAELNELPALVHQMFKLNENESKLFLLTLSKYFATKYAEAEDEDDENGCREIEILGKNSIKEIQDVESTVLYYIYQATKLNHKRLKDLIKFLRSNTAAPELVIEPFIMSVLLLVTEIHPEVLDILKAAVIRQVQDEVKRKHSVWLKNMASQDWSIMEVITKIVVNSDNKDRMLVLKGLIDFSFVLMSSQNKAIKDDIHLGEIGSKIVQKVLRKRHASCSVILQKLTLHIVGYQISNKTQFTDCLSFIGHRMTILVLENKAAVGSLVDQLPVLPGQIGIQIVNALLPVINICPTIKDLFMLILRKCLYIKGTETREVAVIGFLELLKKVKLGSLNALSQSSSQSIASNSSVILTQATLEKHKSLSSNPRNNLALSTEILNILRRCFTHEAEVRICLYKGLHEVVSENENLAMYITTMLFERLVTFYNPNEDIMPPINLDNCIVAQGTEMVVQEPIGDLIYALQRIYIHTAAKSSAQIERLSIILESLCKRMAQIELEHLQMDDQIELLDDIPVALRRLQGLKLCITICEALIVYRIDSWSNESIDFAQNINSLLKAYKRMTECIKKVGKLPKGAKKKSKDKDKDDTDTTVNKKAKNNPLLQIAKIPAPVMEFKTIDKILKLLYLDSVPWTSEEQCENLKSRVDCHHYILQTLLQLLQKAKKQKPIHANIEKYIVSIGKLLYKKTVLNLEEINSFDPKICSLALECFKELCDLMCTCILKDLPTFLEDISDIQRCEGLDAQLRDVIPTMLQIVENNLEEDEENDMPIDSIPTIIMDTISHLLNKMPFDKGNNKIVLDCLYRLTIKVTNKEIACKLAKMLLLVEETLNTKSEILREMCDSLLAENGYLDDTLQKENQISIDHQFESINKSSVKEMYEIVNNAVKEKLNNVDWYFSRLQAEQSSLVVDLSSDKKHEELREKIRSICSQLIVITEIFEVITKTQQKTFFSDSILKNLQLFFKIVCKVTKYFYLTHNIDKEALTSSKFISVIKRTGLEVTNNLYNFITFVETNQKISTSTDHSVRFKDLNKVLRETKCIPKVIYEMEQFRTEVLMLEKKTSVPVGQYVKKVVNRGFKLLDEELDEGLNALDTSNLNTQNTRIDDSEMTETTADSDE